MLRLACGHCRAWQVTEKKSAEYFASLLGTEMACGGCVSDEDLQRPAIPRRSCDGQ